MKRAIHRQLLLLVAMLVIAGPGCRAARQVGIYEPLVDDAGARDGGGACSAETFVCRDGVRLFCDARAGLVEAPCVAGSFCRGDGVCAQPCSALSPRADSVCSVSATTPLHTDVGSAGPRGGDPTRNPGAEHFPFGVLIANAADEQVRFTASSGVFTMPVITIDAHSTIRQMLPWTETIARITPAGSERDAATSAYLPGIGGFTLDSEADLAVWMISPLLPADDRFSDCRESSCIAPTREGTLLSAARTRGTRWVIVSQPTVSYWDSRTGEVFVEGGSFATLQPASPEARTVRVTLSAPVGAAKLNPDVPSPDVPGGLPRETLELSMSGLDVWQLAATPPFDLESCAPIASADRFQRCGTAPDLTGTIVESDAPMRVLAGHECAYVPFDAGVCGYLLEQVPADEWQSSEYVISGLASYETYGATVRLVALSTPTEVRAEPGDTVTPLPGEYDFTLLPGEYRDIKVPTGGLYLSGTAPFSVVRLVRGGDPAIPLVGERATPAMVFAVPTSRWATQHIVPRDGHTVAVVVTSIDATVEVDGVISDVPPVPLPDPRFGWREIPLVLIGVATGDVPVVIRTSMPSSVEVAQLAPASLVLVSAAAR